MRPGPSTSVEIISTMARPGSSSGRRGSSSFTTSATKAGATTSAISQLAASRTMPIDQSNPRQRRLAVS